MYQCDAENAEIQENLGRKFLFGMREVSMYQSVGSFLLNFVAQLVSIFSDPVTTNQQ